MSKRTQELREKTIEELEQELARVQQELVVTRFQLATRQLANYARVRILRHDIARLQFFLSQRKLEKEWESYAVH